MKLLEEEIIKLPVKEIMELGYCPTCLNRKFHGAIYGDNSETLLYRDKDIEIFYAPNPRKDGHLIIMSVEHYQDLSEAPNILNEKIIHYSKMLMNALKEVYGCERVYLVTMCDGPINHYHVQLIPRYKDEEIGSKNLVKPRKNYVFDVEKYQKMKEIILQYGDKK